ncbi:PspA/IM30 family protein [Falsibacillus albus]|uniref:PspA/IM30 family protein n=1 Tax=Falsibacillus albus TaxID=2478915 RepID=A0A3L7JR01_9BACI|nr:PspA/IM30 family protein [Falsibacillus albus]RLQ93096.1 PspA/IM30 family protein [Falsibacillus albus]
MFELFKRVKTIVQAEFHDLLDKAENPIHLMDQYLREMKLEIEDAERATAKMMAEEKLLARKNTELAALLETRQNQAMDALQAGKEELAKKVIEDKMNIQKEQVQLEELHTMTMQHVVDLKDKLRVMKNEYREMEMKRNTLAARAQAAKAKAVMNQAVSASSSSNAKSGFQRMEEKVIRQEAEVQAHEDLQQVNQSLDDELKEISRNKEVEAELGRLKEILAQKKQSG